MRLSLQTLRVTLSNLRRDKKLLARCKLALRVDQKAGEGRRSRKMKAHVSPASVHQDPRLPVLHSDRTTVISAQGSWCPSHTSPRYRPEADYLCRLLPPGEATSTHWLLYRGRGSAFPGSAITSGGKGWRLPTTSRVAIVSSS